MMFSFANEEEKIAALEKFDERTGTEEELNALIDAKVGEEPTTGESAVAGESVASENEPMADTTSSDQVPEEKVLPPETPKDVPQEPDDITRLKQELEEKNRLIQSYYGNLDNVRKLEEKVNALESVSKQTVDTPQEKKELRLRQGNIAKLRNRRKALLEKYASSEDQLDPEYIKEMNEIQSGLMDEIDTLSYNLGVVQSQADTAVQKADNYVSMRKEEDSQKRMEDSFAKQKREVEDFMQKNEQFRTAKSFDALDDEYKMYQTNVAKMYYGRDPANIVEVNEAMDQLRRKSPYLVTKLQSAGIPTEPTDDMKKYLGVCELWDHWQGWRKDPLTGDFRRDKQGNIVQLTRYEPTTGNYVPDTYPSLESAYNDKAAKDGYYTKQVLQAKIQGGKEAIQAATQRGKTAQELGAQETSGGQVQAVEEAYHKIMEMDVDRVMQEAYDGNDTLLNEYNAMAKLLDWPVVDNPIPH